MKTLLVAAALAAGAATYAAPCLLERLGPLPWSCGDGACDAEPAAHSLTGRYVEARDLAVWAGACHRGSEADAQGRSAALAWRFDAGSAFGVDVAGLALAAAVESPQNLAEGAPRRAVAWVDARATPAQRAALRAWLVEQHGAALGELVAFEPAPIELEVAGERFRLAVADVLALEGAALADRECCSMPEQRWYEPLGAAPGALVGVAERCRFAGAAGLAPWTYEDQNNAFVAEFGDACCSPQGRAALVAAGA